MTDLIIIKPWSVLASIWMVLMVVASASGRNTGAVNLVQFLNHREFPEPIYEFTSEQTRSDENENKPFSELKPIISEPSKASDKPSSESGSSSDDSSPSPAPEKKDTSESDVATLAPSASDVKDVNREELTKSGDSKKSTTEEDKRSVGSGDSDRADLHTSKETKTDQVVATGDTGNLVKSKEVISKTSTKLELSEKDLQQLAAASHLLTNLTGATSGGHNPPASYQHMARPHHPTHSSHFNPYQFRNSLMQHPHSVSPWGEDSLPEIYLHNLPRPHGIHRPENNHGHQGPASHRVPFEGNYNPDHGHYHGLDLEHDYFYNMRHRPSMSPLFHNGMHKFGGYGPAGKNGIHEMPGSSYEHMIPMGSNSYPMHDLHRSKLNRCAGCCHDKLADHQMDKVLASMTALYKQYGPHARFMMKYVTPFQIIPLSDDYPMIL